MSHGQNTLDFEKNAVGSIPALVNLVEVLFGRKQGQKKSDAVKLFFANLLLVGGAVAGRNNPAYGDAINRVIDATATVLFPDHSTTDTPAPVTPVVHPPGWGVSPTVEPPPAVIPPPVVAPPLVFPPPVVAPPADAGPGPEVPPSSVSPALPDENAEFEDLGNAIYALHGVFVLVLKKANGKYMIYPNVGPFPGGAERVYPPKADPSFKF